MAEDNLQLLRWDLSNQGKSIAALVDGMRDQNKVLHGLELDQAARAVDRKNLDERIERIEKRMDDLTGLAKWILLAFAASFITAVVTFIVKGGLVIGP